MRKLPAYVLFAYGSLREILTYWKDTLVGILSGFFRIAVHLSAWYALYASVDFASVRGRTFQVMVTYQLIAMLVSRFTDPMRISETLEERMKSGEIAMDFLRPAAPRGILIARSWGEKLVDLCTAGIIVSVTSFVIGGIQGPSPFPGFGIFLLSLVLGYCINLLFHLLMGTFAFWFVAVGTLNWFVDFFQIAMSGAIIPLWLLPVWLRTAAQLLPFQAVIYIPMQIYLGGITGVELARALGVQAFWIVLLYILQEVLWRRGIRRIVVHGG